MTSDNSDQVGLKAQIQRYLVESGNYEKCVYVFCLLLNVPIY